MNNMNPNDAVAIKKVVIAGKKIMFGGGWPLLKQGLAQQMPMPQKLAVQAVGLVKMLQEKAQGQIPPQVLLPAAALLLLEIAKFMADSGYGKPTPEDIKAARPILFDLIQKAFGQPAAQPGAAPGAAPTQPGAPQPPAPGGGLINNAMQGGM